MTREEAVLKKLEEIEQEMRRMGVWSDSLDVAALREQATKHFAEHGTSPALAMSFEQWLQAIFVPNAREAALKKDLPLSSQVGMMALRQYDHQSYVPEAQELLRLLNEFDDLFR